MTSQASIISRWKKYCDILTDKSSGDFYSEYVAPGVLSPFIKCFFSMDFSVRKITNKKDGSSNIVPEEYFERIIPYGCVDLIIQKEQVFKITDPYTKSDYLLPKMFISPMTTHFLKIRMVKPTRILAIRLWPWANSLFIAKTANKQMNHYEQPETLKKLQELAEGKLFDKTVQEAFKEIEYILTCHIEECNFNEDTLITDAINFIITKKGMVEMEDFFSRYTLTSRRIEQRFNEVVGLSPKHYCRVIKFQNIFRVIREKKIRNLTELVYECGYYDQAHFIRNFREFTGTSPRNYFLERNIISMLMSGKNSFAAILNN